MNLRDVNDPSRETGDEIQDSEADPIDSEAVHEPLPENIDGSLSVASDVPSASLV